MDELKGIPLWEIFSKKADEQAAVMVRLGYQGGGPAGSSDRDLSELYLTQSRHAQNVVKRMSDLLDERQNKSRPWREQF